MTDSEKENPEQDWNKLAQEALDLWQNHLNNLANDPKMKEDMARMVAPMGQMFNQWTSIMQSNMQNMATFINTSEQKDDNFQQDDKTSCEPEKTMDTAAPSVQASNEPDVLVAVMPELAKETPIDDQSLTVSNADEPVVADEPTVGSTAIEPTVELAVEPTIAAIPAVLLTPDPPVVATESEPTVVQPTVRGRTTSSDGSRDLAELASRLAQLERELDQLRPSTKRSASGDETSSDATDAGDVQRVAGTRTGSNLT